MKVLGISGSPRRMGNSELLLDECLKGAESRGAELEKIILADLKITPCLELNVCYDKGECPIKDDMKGLYPKLLEADYVVVSSPIFFYTVTAFTKAFIDRCQALWATKYILKQIPIGGKKRKGIFISVGATRGRRLFEGVKLTMKYFFDAIDAEYSGELLIRGIEKKGEIKKHPTALKDAFMLGKNLVREREVKV
ncbi:MAG TPA: flavodoxin family protein [Syntrophaceae bacterium]|nr:flavodoxin family protein [Syntrophaceae bacterium]